MKPQDYIPEDIVAFWFLDGDAPTADEQMWLWNWRMRGGAHEEVVTRFSDLTTRAAAGDLDNWAATPMGRLAMIPVFDQFTRSVWAGTSRAYACDERARDPCLQGLENGYFDALDNVWKKAAFKIPLEHCECAERADHLANLDTAISIADRLINEASPHLRQAYEFTASSMAPPATRAGTNAATARHSRHGG